LAFLNLLFLLVSLCWSEPKCYDEFDSCIEHGFDAKAELNSKSEAEVAKDRLENCCIKFCECLGNSGEKLTNCISSCKGE
jgi:hypothetical protein